MEAHARRHVELEVGVVHAVQPPQRRHRVEQHVLQVDREIEQDHEATMATQAGSVSDLKRPQPRASASSARPTAVVGNSRRTSTVSSTTTPRLLGQRTARPISCVRRGASTSQSAMTAKMPAKGARRMRLVAKKGINHVLCPTDGMTRPASSIHSIYHLNDIGEP